MIGPNVPGNVIKEDDVSALTIGQRIECNGSYGTIMYIGEVPPAKGSWLGIDWDDPKRGKHDGTYNGIKFFQARYPKSASFVRRSKVNVGISCPAAIKERYGEVKGDDTAGIDKKNLELVQKEINARFIEVVGFDKVNKLQSDFNKLRVVWLRGHLVSSAGEPLELYELCPRVEELHLSKNLLSNWETVSAIAEQLEYLKVLDVSENRLAVPQNAKDLSNSFCSLNHIVLGNINYSWNDVLICAEMWPDVEKLQAPFNSIKNLQSPSHNILQNLRELDLEGNKIESWTEVNKLGTLKKLEFLNLTNTSISDVLLPTKDEEQKTLLFPSLKQLMISENNIQQWRYVSELEKLKNLEQLKFRDNPVLEEENLQTSRQLIIARIGNLKVLNSVDITADERRGAEYDYLKRHGQAWLSFSNNPDNRQALNAFLLEHPRYRSLINTYGMPETGEMAVVPQTLKSQLLSIEICVQNNEHKPISKKVPMNMTVQKFTGLIQKLFKLRSEAIHLSYCRKLAPEVEYELDDETKPLSFFAISDGDQILVRL